MFLISWSVGLSPVINWNSLGCVTMVTMLVLMNQEPTDTSKQPIRTRYLGQVTGYQPIRDQYFLIRPVPGRLVVDLSKSSSQQYIGVPPIHENAKTG
eukprot:sb/3479054/